MDVIAALTQANAEFETRLSQVGDDQWGLATPCTEWDVRGLVNHMLLGSRMSVQLLGGMSRDDVIAGLNDDLVSEGDSSAMLRDMNQEMVAAFAAPGVLDTMIDHPAGQFPCSMFIGFRIGDGAAHAWDLARATGLDETLNTELVAHLWEDTVDKVELLAASGLFGAPSGNVGEEAPLQERYLDLVGRRP